MTWSSTKNIIPIRILIPVENFISLRPVSLSKANQIHYPELNRVESAMNCPFKGCLIAVEVHHFFGIPVLNKTLLGVIDDHWMVTATDNSKGWIDSAGQIHKGINGDSNNCNIKDEDVVGRIINNEFFLSGIKVGILIQNIRKTLN